MFSVHVMHVPGSEDREICVKNLLECFPQAQVHEDPERRGILWNYIQVLEAAQATEQEWAVILSDDVVAIEGWETHLRQALFFAPADIVGLTHFADYGVRPAKKGLPYSIGLNLIWGPAHAMKQRRIVHLLKLARYVAELDYEAYRKWDDGLAGVDNRLRSTYSAMTTRAIFEHQPFPSLLGHVPGRWRHATSTIRNAGPSWGAFPRAKSLNIPDQAQDALYKRLKELDYA